MPGIDFFKPVPAKLIIKLMENQSNNQLGQTLMDCAMACENCATACLNEDNVKSLTACIILDRDCADICTLAARLLKRNSSIARQYLLLCEEICRMCADECSKHEHDHCKQCAEACLACAEACHLHHEPLHQD
jgi:hypothetical protein